MNGMFLIDSESEAVINHVFSVGGSFAEGDEPFELWRGRQRHQVLLRRRQGGGRRAGGRLQVKNIIKLSS